MGGGLLQLVAYGAQDVYLTGNPQITFFKVVYRRHTNFSLESIQQTFNGNAELGNRVTCQISRNGDLVHKLYLQITAVAGSSPIYLQPFYGYRMIKHTELEIGGQRIDKQYGEWMYIWNELTMDQGKKEGYYEMVGGNSANKSVKLENETINLYIPLEFWFCRNVGLALPLIALQYHEVKVNIEFNSMENIRATNTDDMLASSGLVLTSIADFESFSATLWADYIFLDTDERKRFAQLSHEYLIEQLQFTGTETITANTVKASRLSFNHPCKELVWAVRPEPDITGCNVNWNNFTNAADNNTIKDNLITTAKLQLNGNDRFAERDGKYFSLVQPYQHHNNIPVNQGINVYSFALKPEEHQPSGTLNMSRIDTAQLQVKSSKPGELFVYAVNYNVLRILSGMGGLAYSN
jgi:hypothetical protein